MEEGKCGASYPVADRGTTEAWLRNLEAHRTAIRRSCHFLCRLPVPAALPPGEARVDPRPMGGKKRAAPQTLLPPDAGRPKGFGCAAPWLEGICGSSQPDHGGGTCLIGVE